MLNASPKPNDTVHNKYSNSSLCISAININCLLSLLMFMCTRSATNYIYLNQVNS